MSKFKIKKHFVNILFYLQKQGHTRHYEKNYTSWFCNFYA
jgi:hypothetical protein